MSVNKDHFLQLELVAQLVSAYVSNNAVPLGNLATLIANVGDTIEALRSSTDIEDVPTEPVPAVPIKKSITPDYLISLEDGRRFKSLKRHLYVQHGMTPEEYRAKWSLPPDYPMIAPNYSAMRSSLAKSTGLGRVPASPEPGSKAPIKAKQKRKAIRRE